MFISILYAPCYSSATLHPILFNNIPDVVSGYDTCSRTCKSMHGFHHYLLFIYPASFCSSFNHRIFSGYIIAGNGQISMLFQVVHDIQISQSRFYH